MKSPACQFRAAVHAARLLSAFAALAGAAIEGFAGAPLSFTAGPFAQGNAGPVALADFNRDGKLDAVHVRPGDGLVKVRLGDGTGALGDPVFTYTLPGTGSGLVGAGDLNGDGVPDFAVSYGTLPTSNPGRVATFFSDGAGGFTAGPVLEVANWPGGIAIRDLNGDGVADLVVGSNNQDQLAVVLGTGGGAFAASAFYSAGQRPYSVAVGDFNQDGKPDIAAAAIDTSAVWILLGNGNGTFSAAMPFAAGAGPISLSAGDVDGDGRLDLVVANAGTDTVSFLYGDGAGGFSAPAAIAVARYARHVLLRDLNGDGKPDLAVSTEFNGGMGSNTVYLLRNLGNRAFDVPVPLFVSGQSSVAPPYLAAGDMSGDARPDVVLGDITSAPPFGSGDRISVYLNATAFPARRADFNGDRRSDILWRHAVSGENYLYPMDGTTILPGEGYLRTVADLNWRIVGLGDFDGDGKADILWRSTATGDNYIYLMNGTTIAGEGYIRTVADQNWRVAGTGDFDGDGKDDILWRNAVTGENYLYFMDGTTIKPSEGYLRTVADAAWQVVGTGDFDGDEKADILWRSSSTGENYLYPMDGRTIKPTEGYLRTVADLNWRVVGVGDLDGNGTADILWRNAASGENYLYPMNGTTILPREGYLRTVADLAWGVVQVGDFDSDGKADIVWRNSSSGENYLYFMDGTTIKPTESHIRVVADPSWKVASGPAMVATFPGALIVNEVDYDTVDTDDAEFIEIYNPTVAAVDLSNLAVVLINGSGQTRAEYARVNLSLAGWFLPAGAYLVICNASVLPTLPAGTLAIQILDNTVQNGSTDGIVVFDTATNTVIDALSYEGSITDATINGAPGTYNLVEGTALSLSVADSNTVAGSLIRFPNGGDTNNANADWRFTSTLTPGAANAP